MQKSALKTPSNIYMYVHLHMHIHISILLFTLFCSFFQKTSRKPNFEENRSWGGKRKKRKERERSGQHIYVYYLYVKASLCECFCVEVLYTCSRTLSRKNPHAKRIPTYTCMWKYILHRYTRGKRQKGVDIVQMSETYMKRHLSVNVLV